MHRFRLRSDASSPPAVARRLARPAATLPLSLSPLLLALGLAAGCASGAGSVRPPPAAPAAAAPVVAPPPTPAPADSVFSAQEAADLEAVQAERYVGPVGSSNADLDAELEDFLGDESDAILTERVDFDIPIVINERVEYYIDYFQHRVRASFEKWLARAPQVVPYLRARFRQEGLPEDLIYISLIESGFSPQATSRASAVGYWQFIASTGRSYGLRVDRWVDERRDLERSTEAAIAYLKDLHERFGSWYLAAAAYNSGEGRIQRAIERYGSEDLWELTEFSYLREETKDYVPKLIAATLIARQPERYGFVDVQPLPPVEFDLVTVPPATDLGRIAVGARTTVATIRSLNPHLRAGGTPPGPSASVRVPRGAADGFEERFAAAPARRPPVDRTHVVRRGDTPGLIARRYGVSVRELMALNRIRDARRLRVGQRLRVPPPPGGWPDAPPPPVAEAPPAAAPIPATPAPVVAEAAPSGSSIERAAGGGAAGAGHPGPVRAQLPPQDLAALARGAGAPASGAVPREPPVADPPAPPAPGGRVVHVVAPGDTLWSIAHLHGVTAEDLRRWNELELTTLRVGQRLVVFPPGPS